MLGCSFELEVAGAYSFARMGGGTAAAASLALVAGLAGSIQVAVMGRFGERIGSFEALAANLLFSTILATTVLLVLRQSLAGFGDAVRSPWWYWIGGGGMGVVVVLTITVVTPRIGAAATIGLLIAGQLAMGVVIDRYGLFGVDEVPLGWPRVLGVLLLAVGAALALRR
jgi:bacterial/archaeal transporter family-2 protein